jgi:hypothetical protein
MVKSAADKRAKTPAEQVTALDLEPLDPLPEAIAAYFTKCDEKLGLEQDRLMLKRIRHLRDSWRTPGG